MNQYQEQFSSMNKMSVSKLPSHQLLLDIRCDSHLYLHSKNEKCIFNKYGQCIKGYRYFCPHCNFGLGGMFSSCHNTNCVIPDNESFTSICDDNKCVSIFDLIMKNDSNKNINNKNI